MAGAPHVYVPGSQSLVLDQPHHLHPGTNQKCWVRNSEGGAESSLFYQTPHPSPTHTPRWFWCKLRSGLHQINETVLTKGKIYWALYTAGSQTFDELIKRATKDESRLMGRGKLHLQLWTPCSRDKYEATSLSSSLALSIVEASHLSAIPYPVNETHFGGVWTAPSGNIKNIFMIIWHLGLAFKKSWEQGQRGKDEAR